MASKQRKNLVQVLHRFYHRPVTKVSLELFLSIGAIIFFAIFAIRPTLLTMSDLIKEIEDKQKLNSQLQRKAAALSTAQEQYQRIGDDISYLDMAIPEQPQLIESLKILEKIALENSILIDSLRVAMIPDESGNQLLSYQTIERIDLYVTLRVMGDYPSIKSFIEDLHQVQRSFVVDEVSFVIDEQGQQQALKANMSVRIPYFGDQDDQQIQATTK